MILKTIKKQDLDIYHVMGSQDNKHTTNIIAGYRIYGENIFGIICAACREQCLPMAAAIVYGNLRDF